MTDPDYFVEDFGLLFEKMGHTRMTGRVYGLLLLAENERLSFHDIVEKLQASKSSISVTLKTLEQVGFIRSVSVPGDRKNVFFDARADELDEFNRSKTTGFPNDDCTIQKCA